MTSTAARELTDPLAQRSLEVLQAGQAPSGALIASPAFDVYRYAWLRDGAFCAHALDVAGANDAARRWHDWVLTSIEAHRQLIASATEIAHAGQAPPAAMPPARYTLDGRLETPDEEDPWPNFQLDGYGMWLWALEQHLAGDTLPPSYEPAVELVAAYLSAAWPLRCFNCWEELDGGIHASTLAAAYAGLCAAARLLGDERWSAAAENVRAFLLAQLVQDGRFRRGPDDVRLDGSLLWLGVPFGVVPPDHPALRATVDAVRRDLTGPDGGVYRYRGDTYYGGGEWLLLTSSLGWHDATVGNGEGFERAQAWVRAQALPNGDLPEQVTRHAQEPAMVEPWQRRWGTIATPLLWSHAMYLIAEAAR